MKRVVAAAVALALAACAHVGAPVRSADDLSQADREEVVEVELTDGSVLVGRMIGGGGPTILFQTPTQAIPRRLEVASIRQITVRRGWIGAAEGAVVGTALGGIALAIFGALGADSPDSCEIGCTPATRSLVFGIFGAGGGAIAGGLIGLVAGARELRSVEPSTATSP